jgi:MFS family permease
MRWRGFAALAVSLLLVGFGQELWARYLPEYLRALGGSALLLGAFGALQDLLDAAYAYPGGTVADRLGSRRALAVFASVSAAGTAVYLLSSSAAALFGGLLLVSAWRSFGLPATFRLTAEELAPGKRIAGFTLQAVVKRIPVLAAPPVGGLLLELLGMRGGMRAGFAISILLTLASLFVLRAGGKSGNAPPRPAPAEPRGERSRVRLAPTLSRLLVADCLVRLCEGLPAVFLVVWAIETVRISPMQFGLLQSILTASAMLSYAPAFALAGRVEKKPFVVATFFCFTLFPLAVLASGSFGHLAAAYVVGGLREIGEPARKALLVDLTDGPSQGRALGLYYAIRGFAVSGAAAVGGLLWTIRPAWTFLAAGLLGAAGTIWAAVALPGERRLAEAA